jgi:hypothetical protein
MDAYGNLTEASEFSSSLEIRIISYLGEEFAIGVTAYNETAITDFTQGDPNNSIFCGIPAGNGPSDQFWLQWMSQPYYYVYSGETDGPLYLNNISNDIEGLPPTPTTFSVNFVDGCWFTLVINSDAVVDCSESDTSEGNPVINFAPNGGDNQKWRAVSNGPGIRNNPS